jgi:hypothetical protein
MGATGSYARGHGNLSFSAHTVSGILCQRSPQRHIRNARLLELEADIADRRMRIGTVLVEWIPASANGAAHELVVRALESGQS